MDNYTPLFILGNPRSGTSLLRIMLTSHSQICIPPECGFIQWWSKKYSKWDISDTKSHLKVREYLDDLATSKKIETWKLDYQRLENLIVDNQPNNYAELSLVVILLYASMQNKVPLVLGDKNNYYISHLSLLGKLYPNAKYIGIIRDGRDVACSYQEMNGIHSKSKYKPILPQSIGDIAREWDSNNQKILEFFALLRKKNYVFVKYEELLMRTEDALRGLCNLLNVAFEDRMLRYYEKGYEPEEMLDWKRKLDEKPDASNIGRHEKLMSKEEIDIFNSLSLKTRQQFDYE